MPQHIRRDLSYYNGNSNRQFFARTIDSIGLSVKAIAGQVAALFGVYDVNDNLIAGFESDGDVFVPNVISRYGEVDEFTLNDFRDLFLFGVPNDGEFLSYSASDSAFVPVAAGFTGGGNSAIIDLGLRTNLDHIFDMGNRTN